MPGIPDLRQRARAALESGALEEVALLWGRVAEKDPAPGTLLECASNLDSAFLVGDASRLLDRLAGHPAASSQHLLSGAKLLFRRGRYLEAARLTGLAHDRDPGNPDTATVHAASLERAGRRPEATEVLRRTLSRHPAHARAVRLLAHLESRLGRNGAARRRLEAQLAAAPSPDDWRLLMELASVLDRLGEFDLAFASALAAKKLLAPRARPLVPAWRALSARQWGVTRLLDAGRLSRWGDLNRRPAPPPNICLMGGFPRSGTTLWEQMLTALPGCVGTGESGILATQFRDPVVVAAPSATAAIDEIDGFDPSALQAGRAEYLRCTAEHLGKPVGDALLIEKDPLITADLALPLRLFPRAKILMPLRDPRDVVVSFFFTIVPLAPNSVASLSLEFTCRYYAEVMRHWTALREALAPGRWSEVRYEDLLDDPERETRGAAAFLGLRWTADALDASARSLRPPATTPTYDDVRRPLYSSSAGRWRNYERYLEPHLETLGQPLQQLGYRP